MPCPVTERQAWEHELREELPALNPWVEAAVATPSAAIAVALAIYAAGIAVKAHVVHSLLAAMLATSAGAGAAADASQTRRCA